MSGKDRFEEIFGSDKIPKNFEDKLSDGSLNLMVVGGDFGLGGMGGIFGSSPLITGDEISYHQDGPKIMLPEGMSPNTARKILDRVEQEQETETTFEKSFRYRPDDGAWAAAQVIRQRYGMSIGERIDMGFFGSKPPETKTITVSLGKTMQVPWGLLSIPTLPGLEILLCSHHDDDYGRVFVIHATGPRKYKSEIEAFFVEVETYLQEHSIYRGQALRGADRLDFLDLSEFDASKVVFSNEVTDMLKGTVWSVIRHTDALREEGIPRKKAVLLHGPYGTGKTSAGQLTAQIAVENGWTFLSAGPDDDVDDVLMTARLYMPAVVFVEDIDTQASTADADEASALLDAFDGITAKGGELVVLLTTNHFERIHKGMLRPGRLDGVVEVNSLDREGVELLIRAVVNPEKLDQDIDFDAVYAAMDGFFPAFVKGATDRAVTFAIDRLDGARNYTLSTDDLVSAASSLRPQLEALNEANEGERVPTLDATLTATITSAAQTAVEGAKLQEGFGGYTLRVPALNGNGRH